MTTDEIRQCYRPDQVRILFVAESPPANGRFFYRKNSQMYKHMTRILGRHLFGSAADFLTNFKASGCFLDDLVLTPGIPSPSVRMQAIAHLTKRIREYRPLVVIALLKRIGRDVRQAATQANVKASFHVTHFPGNGWQGKFEDDINRCLPDLRKAMLDCDF